MDGNKTLYMCSGAKLLEKRQKAKYLATHFTINLINENANSDLIKSYWNTYHCSSSLILRHNKLSASSYCKNRWCAVCNRIRTGVLINRYHPILKEFDDMYFVTLTIPTCSARKLPGQIEEMQKAWRQIYKKSKKAKYKNSGLPSFKGIKKAECTLRPRNKYHYHYHLLIEGKEVADWIIKEWLNYFPTASAKSQKSLKADEQSVKELFKYFTKLLSKSNPKVDYKRMDIIYNSMRGKRVFQPFGLKIDKDDFDENDLESIIEIDLLDDIIYQWSKDYNDWIGLTTGTFLVGKDIPESLKKLVENKL